MPYANVKVTQCKEPIVLLHTVKIVVEVTMSEYWDLLGISFLRERFMKFPTIYVETAAELIEASKCANLNLLYLLEDFHNGALRAYIIPKEEPVFYK